MDRIKLSNSLDDLLRQSGTPDATRQADHPDQTLSLLRDNTPLSTAQLALARQIGEEMTAVVAGRNEYIRKHRIDARFAKPDANWSHDAPQNEFLRLFQRVAKSAEGDIARLRGFTQPFSGYNLFEVDDGTYLSAADIEFGTDFDTDLARRLAARNAPQIEHHKHLVAGLPPEVVFRPPAMLGEIGHVVDGVLVNHDTNAYQERINILHKSGVLGQIQDKIATAGEVKICEIGGGYGALCHWFKQMFPKASYTIIDLPESLLFSRLYVSLTHPDMATTCGLAASRFGVRFVPNFMAEQLDDSFDLIINTLSMSEMTEYQVRKYVHLMSTKWLKEDAVFLEQNHDVRKVGLLFAQEILASEFEYHLPLYPPDADYEKGFPYRHGFPSLWSLNPLDLPSLASPTPPAP